MKKAVDSWTDNDLQPVSKTEAKTNFKNLAITGVLDQETTKVPGTKISGSFFRQTTNKILPKFYIF